MRLFPYTVPPSHLLSLYDHHCLLDGAWFVSGGKDEQLYFFDSETGQVRSS